MTVDSIHGKSTVFDIFIHRLWYFSLSLAKIYPSQIAFLISNGDYWAIASVNLNSSGIVDWGKMIIIDILTNLIHDQKATVSC